MIVIVIRKELTMIVNWKVRSSDDSIFYVCVQILIRHHLMLRIVYFTVLLLLFPILLYLYLYFLGAGELVGQ